MSPKVVAAWLLDLPRWIEVRRTAGLPDAALADRDPGEREALQLPEEQRADLLLIDERRGRLEAKRRGLATTGTPGVLLVGAQKGLLDAAAAYQQLIILQRVRVLGKNRSQARWGVEYRSFDSLRSFRMTILIG